MIDKENIKFHSKTYYTSTYGGVIPVKILRLFEDECVLVKTGKGNPFVRAIKHVHNTQEEAKRRGRDWEHDERKRRKR